MTFIDFDTFDPIANTVSGTTTARNIDARLYGLEASADYDADTWFGRVSLTVPRGTGRGGAGELGSIPQDRLSLTGGIRPLHGLEIGARATFLRDMDASDLPEDSAPMDGAQILDVFANWRPQNGVLQGTVISAGIDNVFDETYRVHPNGLNNPGPTAKLSISRSF